MVAQQVQNSLLNIAKQVFADEIVGINQVLDNLGDEFAKVIDVLLQCQGKIVVTGMGKSGHVARKLAATLASTGTPAFFLHPAEAMHGDLGMVDHKDIVIAMSYSGESDELVTIIPALKHKKVQVVGITGNTKSSLACLANYVLNVKIDKEACPLGLAPTTSTTATLVLGDAIAVTLLSLRGFKKEDFALSHPGGMLGRRLLTTVKDIMHTGARIPRVLPSAVLKDVVVEISNKGLGLTAIVDESDALLGVVTDGDLRRLLDPKLDIMTIKACDIMHHNPKTIKEDSLATNAIDMMEQNKITAILVTNQDNKLVGAFNLHDLFKAKLL